eukprot:scaffold1068_cov375-Prasinococcus_capsulatus_cf.AAC.19
MAQGTRALTLIPVAVCRSTACIPRLARPSGRFHGGHHSACPARPIWGRLSYFTPQESTAGALVNRSEHILGVDEDKLLAHVHLRPGEARVADLCALLDVHVLAYCVLDTNNLADSEGTAHCGCGSRKQDTSRRLFLNLIRANLYSAHDARCHGG